MSRVSSSHPPGGPQVIVFELNDALLTSDGPQIDVGFSYLRAACKEFGFPHAANALRNMGPGMEPPVTDVPLEDPPDAR